MTDWGIAVSLGFVGAAVVFAYLACNLGTQQEDGTKTYTALRMLFIVLSLGCVLFLFTGLSQVVAQTIEESNYTIWGTDNGNVYLLNGTRKVGLGTDWPSVKLDVRGVGNFSGTIYINNATDISTFVSSAMDYSNVAMTNETNDFAKQIRFDKNVTFIDSINATNIYKGDVRVATVNDLTGETNISVTSIEAVRNDDVVTLNKLDAVRFTGYNTGVNRFDVQRANNSEIGYHSDCLILNTIETGRTGQCVIFGTIENADTSIWNIEDDLYLNYTAGTLTNSRPEDADCIQKIAMVLRSHATLGVVWVSGAGRCNDIPSNATFVNLTVNNDLIINGNGFVGGNSQVIGSVALNESYAVNSSLGQYWSTVYDFLTSTVINATYDLVWMQGIVSDDFHSLGGDDADTNVTTQCSSADELALYNGSCVSLDTINTDTGGVGFTPTNVAFVNETQIFTGLNHFSANVSMADNLTVGNALYVDTSAGKVGIGTTSPATSLEINGTGGQMVRYSVSNGTADFGGFEFYEALDGTSTLAAVVQYLPNGWEALGDRAGTLEFLPTWNHVAIGSTSNVFKQGGDIGFGVVYPTHKLNIEGNINITGLIGTNGPVYANNGLLQMADPSSIEYKENVGIKSENYTKIMDLKVKNWNWKGTNQSSFGFVAEEVRDLFPELYSEGSYKDVCIGEMVNGTCDGEIEPQLVNGTAGWYSDKLKYFNFQNIKTLWDKVFTDHEDRIVQLEAENLALQLQIIDLTARIEALEGT